MGITPLAPRPARAQGLRLLSPGPRPPGQVRTSLQGSAPPASAPAGPGTCPSPRTTRVREARLPAKASLRGGAALSIQDRTRRAAPTGVPLDSADRTVRRAPARGKPSRRGMTGGGRRPGNERLPGGAGLGRGELGDRSLTRADRAPRRFRGTARAALPGPALGRRRTGGSEPAPAGWTARTNDPAAPARTARRPAARSGEQRCPRPLPSAPYLVGGSTGVETAARPASLEWVPAPPVHNPPSHRPTLPQAPPPAPRARVTHAQTSLPGPRTRGGRMLLRVTLGSALGGARPGGA